MPGIKDGLTERKAQAMQEKDKSYLAGLFDADGCASNYMQRYKKSNKTTQVHSCEIAMTNKEVIYWVIKLLLNINQKDKDDENKQIRDIQIKLEQEFSIEKCVFI